MDERKPILVSLTRGGMGEFQLVTGRDGLVPYARSEEELRGYKGFNRTVTGHQGILDIRAIVGDGKTPDPNGFYDVSEGRDEKSKTFIFYFKRIFLLLKKQFFFIY